MYVCMYKLYLYRYTGRDNKESEHIHIYGINVGGGWRTRRRHLPQSRSTEYCIQHHVKESNQHKHDYQPICIIIT